MTTENIDNNAEDFRNSMKSSAPLRLHFKGASVDDHKMPAKQLGPSLIALSNFLGEINDFTNKDKTRVQLYVRAFEPGSFGIDFSLVSSFVQQVQDFFTGPGITSVLNADNLVHAAIDLFFIWKFLGRKKEYKIEELPKEPENIKLIVGSKELVVGRLAYQLYIEKPELKETADAIIAPVGTEGFDEVEIGDTNKKFSLSHSEYQAFIESTSEEELSDNVLRNVALIVEAPYFKPGKKWRFSLGGQPIFAAIQDEAFQEKVLTGEDFAIGDVIIADVVMNQTLVGNKITVSYNVFKVHDHKKAPRQLFLKD